jgi:hypothetical protein
MIMPSTASPAAGVDPSPPIQQRWLSRWSAAAVAGAGMLVLLLWLGVPIIDLGRYLLYICFATLLPGVLVYRALRRDPHSLVDDLAMGLVMGFVVEIAGYVLFGALGLLPWLLVWPALIVLAFVAIPQLRPFLRTPAYRTSAPKGWSWAVLAVLVVYVAYIVNVQMAAQTAEPAGGGSRYLYDLLYLLSLSAEAKHHFPMEVPQTAGEPMHYHWFASAHQAYGSIVSGVDLPGLYFSFDPLLIAVAGVLMLAVAGWRITGRPWVGVLAAALTFAVGELSLQTFSAHFGSSTTFVWTSITTTFAWPFVFALLMVVVDLIRDDGLPEAGFGRRRVWALLALVGLALTGAKASGLPPIVAGICVVIGIGLLRRRNRWRIWAIVLVLGAAYLFATAVIYRFESLGVSWGPLFTLRVATDVEGSWLHRSAVAVIGLAGYTIYQLARLAGIVVLGWLALRKRAAWGDTEWFLLGAIASGVAVTLLLEHPGTSQLYFIRSIWGAGAILSAWGFVVLAERHRLPGRLAGGLVLGAATAAALLVARAERSTRLHYTQLGVHIWRPVVAAAVIAVALIVAALVAVAVLRRRLALPTGTASAAALAVVLMAGSAGLYVDTRSYGHEWTGWHERVTPDMVSAAQWLRDNSDPSDVVATNQHAPVSKTPPDLHLSFWINAYAERRTLVGSWSYVPRLANVARDTGVNAALLPFWDEDLLALNDGVFTDPTEAALQDLRNRGVRWLLVNRDIGAESPDLARLTTLRLVRGPIAIYQVNAESAGMPS